MKLTSMVPSIAVLAMGMTGLVAAPASASEDSRRGDDKPQILKQHVKETQNFPAGDKCRFPVQVKVDVHIRDVITNGGDNVEESTRGAIKVTNVSNHKSMWFRIDDEASIRVSEDGDSIKGRAHGRSLLLSNDITVTKRGHHISAASRGHARDRGIYYIHGSYKFKVEGLTGQPEKIASDVWVKRGHVLDVCDALAKRRHHHHH
jgi:hypothetical protein